MAVLLLLTAACQPTGDAGCDAQLDARITIDAYGWTLDCTPDIAPFDNDGNPLLGWADRSTNTVYVWPAGRTTSQLRATLLHEAGHVHWYANGLDETWWREVRGIDRDDHTTREDHANVYSWCRSIEDGPYRFAAGIPDAHDCEAAT